MIFMSEAIIVIALILMVVFGLLFWKIGSPKKIVEYFKTKDGLGALKGIILAPVVILVFALIFALLPGNVRAGELSRALDNTVISNPFAGGTWFNEANVFMGIDYTKKVSPMCDRGGYDDRATSNMGFEVNMWRNGGVDVNAVYTHHSCAIGSDASSYDAFGIRVVWKVWER